MFATLLQHLCLFHRCLAGVSVCVDGYVLSVTGLKITLQKKWWLVPEVLMKGESCNARSPLVSSVLSLTVNNLT